MYEIDRTFLQRYSVEEIKHKNLANLFLGFQTVLFLFCHFCEYRTIFLERRPSAQVTEASYFLACPGDSAPTSNSMQHSQQALDIATRITNSINKSHRKLLAM